MRDSVIMVRDLWADPETAARELALAQADLEEQLTMVKDALRVVSDVMELNHRLVSHALSNSGHSTRMNGVASESVYAELRVLRGQTAHDIPVVEDWVDESDLTRRTRILQLLREVPDRHWTARLITEKCGLSNLRSVRVLLSDMVDRGELVKIPGPPGSRKVFYQIASVRTPEPKQQ